MKGSTKDIGLLTLVTFSFSSRILQVPNLKEYIFKTKSNFPWQIVTRTSCTTLYNKTLTMEPIY